ncbi:response regulator [Thermodesulfobacterium sp. TA1]|uniref:response regulator n=1 Tax=Thermodesulfobacterium sp. TA1 TaxID=2234087 RepID=UPI0012326F81|nr:response regulator [Thermodesulfobacterium sp. TA1]QER42178.1 response regulator [Thermodesulfobacterium sp. TA1]
MIYLALSEDLFNRLKEVLEKLKLKYKLIEDGETLLKLSKKEKPKLIVLEKDIPLLDGFATTLLLKSSPETQDIPILGVCKVPLKEEETKAKDCGCDDILVYPFKEEEFLNKVLKYIKK